jgi:hypothetical protein
MQLAYITSFSYSGSTLLTFLLATHPEIATIGELKASALGDVESYHCSCGSLIRECGFWRELAEELEKREIEFDLGNFGTHFRCLEHPVLDRLLRTGVRGPMFEKLRTLALHVVPGAQHTYHAILEKNKAFIEVLTHQKKASVFLDGSKDPNRLEFLTQAGYWPIKTIYLIRDGRGAAASYMKHYNVPMEVAAKEWRQKQRECDQLMAMLPTETWRKVHYEDLCRQPDQLLADLCNFLELDPTRLGQDFLSAEQHILGNAMRMNTTAEIKLDEKWRNTLSSSDFATFDHIAGELNRSYGYGA